MTFVHMSGAGNCFLVADARSTLGTLLPEDVSSAIASHKRHDGLPVEGLLLLRKCSSYAVTADFYNIDGTVGMMCGNGARCIVRFAADHGLSVKDNIDLTLNGMKFRAHILSSDAVMIEFPAPREVMFYASGSLDQIDIDVWYVDVGSDHAVIAGPLDASRPVVGKLRRHPRFPLGANVNMVEADGQTLHVATFERGVEAVTGACGTGALSCAVAAWSANHTQTAFTVIPPSGRRLTIELHIADDTIAHMTLTGDALYDNP